MISGSFDAVGVSPGFIVKPGDKVRVRLDVAATEEFIGKVLIEDSKDNMVFNKIVELVGTALAPLENDVLDIIYKNEDTVSKRIRVNVEAFDVASDDLLYLINEEEVILKDAKLKDGVIKNDALGINLMEVKESHIVLRGMQNLLSKEEIVTNDTTAEAVDLDVYLSEIVSSGSEGGEDLTVPNGSIIGERKLIIFKTRAHASDQIDIAIANITTGGVATTAVALDAEGEFVLLEWHGSAWEIVASDATVTTA